MIEFHVQFCAGHRVAPTATDKTNPCRWLHGHTYKATFVLNMATAKISPNEARVMVESWVLTRWDGGFVLHAGDYATANAVMRVDGQKHYTMGCAPTISNMAAELWVNAAEMLGPSGAQVEEIRLWDGERAGICRGNPVGDG